MTYTGQQVITNRTAVQYNPVLGRYLVNGSDAIKSKDILIEELPFAIGPKCNGPVLCLECYTPLQCDNEGSNGTVNNEEERCPDCGWPLCVECQKSEQHIKYHKRYECHIFSQGKVKFYNFSSNAKGWCPQLDCITPLRYTL